MAKSKTLVIYDVTRKVKCDIIEREKSNWFTKVAVTYQEYRLGLQHIFNVVYPDKTREEDDYIYFTAKSKIHITEDSSDSWISQAKEELRKSNNALPSLSRQKDLQKVINILEDEGYYAPVDKIALFMNARISKLIMQRK